MSNSLLGGQFCMDSVDVMQDGDNINSDKQAIIPQFKFSCNGRITSISAGVEMNEGMNMSYPLFQIWRPVSNGSTIYNKIGEVQLESNDQVTGEYHQKATIIVTADNTIEVQSGDVVGYYHPPNSRYLIKTRKANGYIQYQLNGSSNASSVDLNNAYMYDYQKQPLIQFTIGK